LIEVDIELRTSVGLVKLQRPFRCRERPGWIQLFADRCHRVKPTGIVSLLYHVTNAAMYTWGM